MHRIALPLLLIALVLAPSPAAAQKRRRVKKAGQGRTLKVDLAEPAGMHYWLFVPGGIRKGRRYPLVLALHGNGEKAANRIRNMSRVSSAALPTFVVAPQYQVTPKFEARPRLFPGRSKAIRGILDRVCREHPIDRGRIVLQGFSMGSNQGSYLVWEWFKRDPKAFPFRAFWMSSTCDPNWRRQPPAPRIPYLLFCGEKETAVKGVVNVVAQVRAGYGSLFKQGYDVRYIEIAGMKHTVSRACLEHMRDHLATLTSYADLAAGGDKLPPACAPALDRIAAGDFAGALAALEGVASGLTGGPAARIKGYLRKLEGAARKVAARLGKVPRQGGGVELYLEARRLAGLHEKHPVLGAHFATAVAKLEAHRRLRGEIAGWRAYAEARKAGGDKVRAGMAALAAGPLRGTAFGRRAAAHLQALGG